MIDVEKIKDGFSLKKEGTPVLYMKVYQGLHAGVIHIRELPFFRMLDQEEKSECFEKIKHFVYEFENRLGDVLRFVADMSADLKAFLKTEMQWEEHTPEIEKSLTYAYYSEMKPISGLFVSYAKKNVEQYERDLDVLEKCKHAIERCKQRYAIYGDWNIGLFTFYFYRKTDRQLLLTFENDQYCIIIGEEKCMIEQEEETQTEITKKITKMLENIVKKERMLHVCEEEKSSFLFFKSLDYDELEVEQIETIWRELRKIYSYDEMEQEALLYIEKEEAIPYEYAEDIAFGAFLSHYFACDEREGVVFVAKTKQELFSEMVQHKQKKWEEACTKVEQKNKKK